MTVPYSSLVCSEAQKHLLIVTIVSSLQRCINSILCVPLKYGSQSLDVETLAEGDELADKYNITVTNSFQALGEDVESSWLAIRNVILQSARNTLPVVQKAKRSWLTADTVSILDEKHEARLRGSTDDWRKYKGIFKAWAKQDVENYYSRLADEAEEGVKRHNLRSVFRAVRKIASSPSHHHSSNRGDVPMLRSDDQSCRSTEKTLECWRSHYQNALNHPPATQCQSLDSDAVRAVSDPAISDDASTLGEIRRAIRKLRNGRAAGSDGIQPELLKYVEEPVTASFHSLCACMEVRSKSCRVARRNHCLTVQRQRAAQQLR